jgi:hypothetical protein
MRMTIELLKTLPPISLANSTEARNIADGRKLILEQHISLLLEARGQKLVSVDNESHYVAALNEAIALQNIIRLRNEANAWRKQIRAKDGQHTTNVLHTLNQIIAAANQVLGWHWRLRLTIENYFPGGRFKRFEKLQTAVNNVMTGEKRKNEEDLTMKLSQEGELIPPEIEENKAAQLGTNS